VERKQQKVYLFSPILQEVIFYILCKKVYLFSPSFPEVIFYAEKY